MAISSFARWLNTSGEPFSGGCCVRGDPTAFINAQIDEVALYDLSSLTTTGAVKVALEDIADHYNLQSRVSLQLIIR